MFVLCSRFRPADPLNDKVMATAPTSPTYPYALEFASRVGAILAALLALIARRIAGHPLLAPLSHRLTAIAEEFERLLADLAAHRLSCRHTGPGPHPENLRRPHPLNPGNGRRVAEVAPVSAQPHPIPAAPAVGCIALRDPATPPPAATIRTAGRSAGFRQAAPAPKPMGTWPGGLRRDRLPVPPLRSRAPLDRTTRTARIVLRNSNIRLRRPRGFAPCAVA